MFKIIYSFGYLGQQIPPTFDVPLKPVSLNEGERLSLSCHISGSSPLSVQWMKDRKEVVASASCRMSFVDGTATLTVDRTSKADAGDYLCKAANNVGSDFSKVKVTIKGTRF